MLMLIPFVFTELKSLGGGEFLGEVLGEVPEGSRFMGLVVAVISTHSFKTVGGFL